MILITKMVLAHLLGDFVLQPASWVKARDTHMFRAWQLYVHAALHGALAALFVAKISFLPWAVMLAAFHLVTDAGKQPLQQKYGRRTAFFADQAIHLATLLLIAVSRTVNSPLDELWIPPPSDVAELFVTVRRSKMTR